MRNAFILFSLLLLCNVSFASVGADMDKLFNSLGNQANVTTTSAYSGQRAGYFNGGSLFVRNPIKRIQIAHIDLPTYRAGCGGIDVFTGGFSFINSEELIRAAKSILNNAKGYAFNLALETVTPQIANVKDKLQHLANRVNLQNINSCEAAVGLVGSLWPKTQMAQEKVCANLGSGSLFSDYAAARQGCGVKGQMKDVWVETKNNHPQNADAIIDNINVAWQILQKDEFFKHDIHLSEFLMSLSGTLILDSQHLKSPKGAVLPSLAIDKSLLTTLLYGGDTQIYRCTDLVKDEKCLSPRLSRFHINKSQALTEKIRTLLRSMVQKIVQDTALTPTEIGLLQATRLPIYKMLNVNAAFNKHQS